MSKERLKKIITNPQDFVSRINGDSWVSIKKKEDIKGLTSQEIIDSKSYYLNHSADFVDDVLNILGVKILKYK